MSVPFPNSSRSAKAASKLHGIIKRLKALPKISTMGQGILKEIEEVFSILTEELPGMPEKGKPGRFCKPTLDQVIYFCKAEGKPVMDGKWFFLKCDGCGWKNNGKAIVNWESTMRAWWLAGVFPSQKDEKGNVKALMPNRDLLKAIQKAKGP